MTLATTPLARPSLARDALDLVTAPSQAPTRAAEARLRVAMLVNFFPVVSETFVLNQAAGLLDRGHEVDIFALWGLQPPGPADHGILATHGLRERAFDPAIPANKAVRLAAAGRPLARVRATRGVSAAGVLSPLAHGKRAVNLRMLFEAAMFLDRPSADIVHCQFATLAPYALAHRRAGSLRGRIVAHLRGYDVTQEVARLGRAVYVDLFREVDYAVANSRFLAARALELGAREERLAIVPSAIDVGRFPYRERRPAADGPIRLISIGRLVEKKGMAYLIDAVARLRRQDYPVVLRIVGDGPLRAELAHRIEAAGLFDHVTLVGALSHERLVAELDAADLCIAASVTAASGDADGPVNTLKEAMAAGLPAIGTRHGGIPELIEDGATGYLVPERDPAALAFRIAGLIESPDLWGAFARRARAKVEAEFDVPAVTDRLVDIYRQCLS
ncbi:MAG: glycosyltransferase [Azospirillaceae bacterium]